MNNIFRIRVLSRVFVAAIVIACIFGPAGPLQAEDASRDVETIYVVAGEWIWKFQHADGRIEVNELHIPVNGPIEFMMMSKDLKYRLAVPELKIAEDILPNNFSKTLFNPAEPGKFELFCSRNCGIYHSRMKGFVYVLSQDKYELWLAGKLDDGKTKKLSEEEMITRGEEVYRRLRCNTCHGSEALFKAPDLANLLGRTITFEAGEPLVADENYIRRSILNPLERLVKDFEANMPVFEGLITDDELDQVIQYINSL
jgi:cytochrome c oxidase subunit 2